MTLRLVQLIAKDGQRAVAVLAQDRGARRVAGVASTYELAQRAIAAGASLQAAVDKTSLRRLRTASFSTTWRCISCRAGLTLTQT